MEQGAKAESEQVLQPGDRVGSYRIVRQIGEGGMGAVYEGINDDIQRRAAIKILHRGVAADAAAANRFLNEARAVNIINHPGIVQIFEVGKLEGGTPYIVMELLEGETLRSRVARRGGMGLDALRPARQVASALAAAHAKGVVHRDLKPDNVFIVAEPELPGGERCKVLDFGIAKLSETPGPFRTRTDVVMGTPAYMAPEQCRGAAHVDAQVDVYALGVILFQMLADRLPFTGTDSVTLMYQHMTDPPPQLDQLTGAVPPEVARLVSRMLAKEPGARPLMAEVVRELERLGSGGMARSQSGLFPIAEAHAAAAPTLPPTVESARKAGEPERTPPGGTMAEGVSHRTPRPITDSLAHGETLAATPQPRPVPPPPSERPATPQSAESTPGEAPQPATDHPIDKAIEKAPDKAVDQLSDKPVDKAPDRAPDKAVDKARGREVPMSIAVPVALGVALAAVIGLSLITQAALSNDEKPSQENKPPVKIPEGLIRDIFKQAQERGPGWRAAREGSPEGLGRPRGARVEVHVPPEPPVPPVGPLPPPPHGVAEDESAAIDIEDCEPLERLDVKLPPGAQMLRCSHHDVLLRGGPVLCRELRRRAAAGGWKLDAKAEEHGLIRLSRDDTHLSMHCNMLERFSLVTIAIVEE